MSDPTKTQVGGDHYKNLAIQPAEYIAKNKLGFFEGCAIKYITRHQFKNGVQDIDKAIHFLKMLKWWTYGVDSSSQKSMEKSYQEMVKEYQEMMNEYKKLMNEWLEKQQSNPLEQHKAKCSCCDLYTPFTVLTMNDAEDLSSQRKEEITKKSVLEEKNERIKELEEQRDIWMQRALERRKQIGQLEKQRTAWMQKASERREQVEELEKRSKLQTATWRAHMRGELEKQRTAAARLKNFVVTLRESMITSSRFAYIKRNRWEELEKMLEEEGSSPSSMDMEDALLDLVSRESITFKIIPPTTKGGENEEDQVHKIEYYKGHFVSVDCGKETVTIDLHEPVLKTQERG